MPPPSQETSNRSADAIAWLRDNGYADWRWVSEHFRAFAILKMQNRAARAELEQAAR